MPYNKEEVMKAWRDTDYMTGEKPNQNEQFLSTALDAAFKAGVEYKEMKDYHERSADRIVEALK